MLTLVLIAGFWLWSPSSGRPVQTHASALHDESAKPAAATDNAADSWAGITNAVARGVGKTNTNPSSTPSSAQPMAGAIASLQGRLAKGGGSADDWELLAKSYEFLGRPAEASKARAHQLPPLPAESSATENGATPIAAPAPSVPVVSGEVSLAAALKAKAAASATLFIIAKSVDSPGPPVAVFRTAADRWPVKFELSDSQSMLPGRNLSNGGPVTIEARISQSGQPLPAAGDLQGAAGPVDPADHRPVNITIDKIVK